MEGGESGGEFVGRAAWRGERTRRQEMLALRQGERWRVVPPSVCKLGGPQKTRESCKLG